MINKNEARLRRARKTRLKIAELNAVRLSFIVRTCTFMHRCDVRHVGPGYRSGFVARACVA